MRRELGCDASITEAHCAGIGDLGPRLPQRRELGCDASVAEAH
jgi:hypothetical protein